MRYDPQQHVREKYKQYKVGGGERVHVHSEFVVSHEVDAPVGPFDAVESLVL